MEDVCNFKHLQICMKFNSFLFTFPMTYRNGRQAQINKYMHCVNMAISQREALSGRGLDTRKLFVAILYTRTSCKKDNYVCGTPLACFSETRILTFSSFSAVVILFKYRFSLLLFKIMATDIQTLLFKSMPLCPRL